VVKPGLYSLGSADQGKKEFSWTLSLWLRTQMWLRRKWGFRHFITWH
jgi:hypothetical protein